VVPHSWRAHGFRVVDCNEASGQENLTIELKPGRGTPVAPAIRFTLQRLSKDMYNRSHRGWLCLCTLAALAGARALTIAVEPTALTKLSLVLARLRRLGLKSADFFFCFFRGRNFDEVSYNRPAKHHARNALGSGTRSTPPAI